MRTNYKWHSGTLTSTQQPVVRQPDHYEQSATNEEVTLPFEHPGNYEVCKEEETARVYSDIEIEDSRLAVVFGAIVMLSVAVIFSNIAVDLITTTL